MRSASPPPVFTSSALRYDESMRSITIERPGSCHVTESSSPVPGSGELLVRVAACGICGTDVHIYEGSYLGTYPVIPGHELAGVVAAVGDGVMRFSAGDPVAIEPNLACGNCSHCLAGRPNFCEHWEAVGVTRPGGMAEMVVVPERAAFSATGLPLDVAAFMEPLSCVLHGLSHVSPAPGSRAAVIGCGPIGLLLIRALRASGVVAIDVAERADSRRELVASEPGVGLVAASAAALQADAYDLVVDATGAPEAMRAALGLARPGGSVLWFGVPDRAAEIAFEPFVVFRKGLSIHGSFTSSGSSEQSLALLRAGTIRVDDLVSHRVRLDDVGGSLERLRTSRDGTLKVIVEPED